MLATFSVISDQAKLLNKRISIDNCVFKLHYRVTFLLLMGCTVLVTSRQYIGEHIKCIVGSSAGASVPQHVMETFCFFTSTYTVVRHLNPRLVSTGYLPHPGVGPANFVGYNQPKSGGEKEEEEEMIRHAYYQWVPFVLFAQAIMFYLPHYVWRQAEDGRMKALVTGLQAASISEHASSDIELSDTMIPGRNTARSRMKAARSSFLLRVHSMRPWSSWLICCEAANAVNILLQVALTDKLLGGNFRQLGVKVVTSQMDEMDYLDVAFPKVTKCDFYKYGPSGSIQRLDALCVMALNVINEKIFVFLWFWYSILAVCTVLGLIYRVITLALHSRSRRFNRYLFQFAAPSAGDYWSAIELTRQMHFSDWLFLYYFAKNVEGFVFRDFFLELARELDEVGIEELRRIRKDSTEFENSLDDIAKSENDVLKAKSK